MNVKRQSINPTFKGRAVKEIYKTDFYSLQRKIIELEKEDGVFTYEDAKARIFQVVERLGSAVYVTQDAPYVHEKIGDLMYALPLAAEATGNDAEDCLHGAYLRAIKDVEKE